MEWGLAGRAWPPVRGLQLIESLSKVYYEEEGKEARKQFHCRMSKGMDCCLCKNNGHDEKTKNKEHEEYISYGLTFYCWSRISGRASVPACGVGRGDGKAGSSF